MAGTIARNKLCKITKKAARVGEGHFILSGDSGSIIAIRATAAPRTRPTVFFRPRRSLAPCSSITPPENRRRRRSPSLWDASWFLAQLFSTPHHLSLVRFPQRKHPGSGSSMPLHSLRSIPLDSAYPPHSFNPTEWVSLCASIKEYA